MKTFEIIKVEIHFNHEQLPFKGSEAHISYFSNLSVAFRSLESILLINDWSTEGFNYTALYRSMKAKGTFIHGIKRKNITFFRIKITKKTVNPKLETFGIGAAPHLE